MFKIKKIFSIVLVLAVIVGCITVNTQVTLADTKLPRVNASKFAEVEAVANELQLSDDAITSNQSLSAVGNSLNGFDAKNIDIYSDYMSTDVLNVFLDNQRAISEMLPLSLERDGYSVSGVSIGTPFNLQNTNVYYFPVISNGDIITLIQITYNNNSQSYVTIERYFAPALNSLDSSQVYSIVLENNSDVFAISQSDTVVLHSIEGEAETSMNSNSIMSKVHSPRESVNIEDVILNIEFAQTTTRAAGSGRYLYNYPALQQTTFYNCWATAMAIILRGNYSTIDEVHSRTGVSSTNTSGRGIYAIHGYYINLYNMRYAAILNNASFSDYINEINNYRALHVSLQGNNDGHSVVAIGYTLDSYNPNVGWITYRNPATGGTGDALFNGSFTVNYMTSSIALSNLY